MYSNGSTKTVAYTSNEFLTKNACTKAPCTKGQFIFWGNPDDNGSMTTKRANMNSLHATAILGDLASLKSLHRRAGVRFPKDSPTDYTAVSAAMFYNDSDLAGDWACPASTVNCSQGSYAPFGYVCATSKDGGSSVDTELTSSLKPS